MAPVLAKIWTTKFFVFCGGWGWGGVVGGGGGCVVFWGVGVAGGVWVWLGLLGGWGGGFLGGRGLCLGVRRRVVVFGGGGGGRGV